MGSRLSRSRWTRYALAWANATMSWSGPIILASGNLLLRLRERRKWCGPSSAMKGAHLHGHSFQVKNGTGHGPLKDTVLVEPMQQLTLDWISDNPGRWAFHCHNLYHMMAGMMRIVKVG